MGTGADTDGRSVAQGLARSLAEAAGGSVQAVVLYGSHLFGLAGEHSAVDLVAVVDGYPPFYSALGRARELHRPVSLMSAAARVLPPNVIAYAPELERGPIAKVLVVDTRHLARALGPSPADHFLAGRLIQRVEVIWATDEAARERVEALVRGALDRVLSWSLPYLEGTFDAEGLGRRLLEILYRGEVRPEAADRSREIFDSQREHFRERLTPVLERGAAEGVLVREGDGYRLAAPVGARQRLRARLYFTRSKARATARWLKHAFTFANWLPYVVRKVERHTGAPIELTRLERRWPLVFLWPRAIRMLRSRPSRGPER